MNGESTISRRLNFNMIDPSTGETLRQWKSFVLAEMAPVLDTFYDHVAKFPETAAFFKNRAHMMHAKDMQLNHWAIILDGRFDSVYEASVTKIGEVHNKLGLEPRWYIGGYNTLVSGLLSAINERLPSGRFDSKAPAKKAALQQAVVKAAMLDMDLAIAVYIDAGRRGDHPPDGGTGVSARVDRPVPRIGMAVRGDGRDRLVHASATGRRRARRGGLTSRNVAGPLRGRIQSLNIGPARLTAPAPVPNFPA